MNKKTRGHALSTVPGYVSSTPGIQIGATISHDTPEEELKLLRQFGVEWVMVNVNEAGYHRVDGYRSIADRLSKYDLKIYRIANHSLHNMDEVTLGLPGRDAKIDEFHRFLSDIAEVGVKYHTYAHMANGIWSADRVPGRGGSMARSWTPNTAIGRWRDTSYRGELTHGREFSEDELWEHYEYFIRRVVPVAEELGVRIGIHPDDPPVEALGGIPRCIFGTFDGYKKALEIADSPNIGMCLCCGCWLEGGDGMGAGLLEAIEFFSGKLFKVHFRNVSNPMPDPWHETFIDNGYMDMTQVMKKLDDVGFDGCVIADHIPETSGGNYAGLAHSIGYMRGLIQAVSSLR